MDFFSLLLSSLAVISFTLIILKRVLQPHQGLNYPPSGPSGFPIIGHLYLLSKPLHQCLTRVSAKYGPVLFLYFGSRPILLVSSSSAAEECLVKNDVTFANRPNLVANKYYSYFTILGSINYGPFWRDLKKFSTREIFSSARIIVLSHLRQGELNALLRQLFSSSVNKDVFQKVEMHSKLFQLTANMIMQMVVGKRYYGESGTEGNRFREIIKEANHLNAAPNPKAFLPIMRFLGESKVEKSLEALGKELDELLQGMVEDRKINRRINKEEQELEKNKTIVDVMLALQETNPMFYSDKTIKGTIMMMVTAGIDTAAGTMEWVLTLLLNHPEKLKKVREEIDVHVGTSRLINESDLPNLRYMHNVIKETLRLYPAGPLMVPHESSADCKVAGYDIPRGTILMVNVYSIQRDPSLWEDATSFVPERFDQEGAESVGSKFIPFGKGRRSCPGELMANKIIGLALGALIQCFDWERIGDEAVDVTEGHGSTLPKAVPLEALCRPRSAMFDVLSQL